MDTSPSLYDLPYIGTDKKLVVSFGASSLNSDGVVPFSVPRQQVWKWPYNPITQKALSAALAAAGTTPTFANDVLFGLSGTATTINGVTNIFDTSTQQTLSEMYQVFYGIASPHLRVWLKQPQSNFVGQADQNITPQSGYSDVGFIDGQMSPYWNPSPRTEFFSLFKLAPRWAMANTAPWTVVPRFNFVVNRMLVNIVTNPDEIRAILQHRVPTRAVTIGDAFTPTTFSNTPYAKIGVLDPAIARLPNEDFAKALVAANYMTTAEAAKWLAGGH